MFFKNNDMKSFSFYIILFFPHFPLRHMKTAIRLFLKRCSYCTTGQHNALKGKHYLCCSIHKSSQVHMIGQCCCDLQERERVCQNLKKSKEIRVLKTFARHFVTLLSVLFEKLKVGTEITAFIVCPGRVQLQAAS